MARLRACTLGAVEYPDAVLKGVPAGWGLAVMLKWGKKDSLAVIEKFARSGRFSFIDVPLAAFDYSHKYPIDKLLGSVLKDAARVEQLARKYPAVNFRLSPFWEHNHPRSRMVPVFQKLKEKAPSCDFINAIWKGETVPGIITEIHLENSKPKRKPSGSYIVCTDGFGGDGSGNIADADVPTIMARYLDAETFSVWSFGMNGKYGWKDPRPIEKRDDYARPEYLTGHCQLLLGREGAKTWKSNTLYKCFADDHDEPNGKDNKALTILPWKASIAEVLDSRGKVIDKMGRVLPDYKSKDELNGNARYYSARYAYQIAQIAKKNTGSKLIRIRVGRNVSPPTDAVHRSNRFR